MAGFGAFKLVRTVSGRVGSLLGLTPLAELPRRLSPPAGGESGDSAEPGGAEAVGPQPREAGFDAAGPTASEASGPGREASVAGEAGLDAGRLDAALERLRATSEPQPEDT